MYLVLRWSHLKADRPPAPLGGVPTGPGVAVVVSMGPTQVPSGYVKIAIENGHRTSGFTHEKWWIFP